MRHICIFKHIVKSSHLNHILKYFSRLRIVLTLPLHNMHVLVPFHILVEVLLLVYPIGLNRVMTRPIVVSVLFADISEQI